MRGIGAALTRVLCLETALAPSPLALSVPHACSPRASLRSRLARLSRSRPRARACDARLAMGVDGFFPLVSEQAPSAVEVLLRPPPLEGKTIGVDVAVLLHRARASCSLRWAYLPYMADRLRWLRDDLGADVLCVFDGEHPAEKEEETRKRAARAASAQESLRAVQGELLGESDWGKLEALRAREERMARGCARPTREDQVLAQRLIEGLGIRYWRAPGEAEAALALLQRRGCIDEIVTEDSDALVCGAHSILRNFWCLFSTAEARSDALAPQRVELARLLSELSLDQDALRTACVLAGCDFAPKLRNVGLKRALKAVRERGCSLSACMHALKHGAAAADVALLARFEAARRLLDYGAAEAEGATNDAGLPQRRTAPEAICRHQLALLVSDVEDAGEPWLLRASLRDVLAPESRRRAPVRMPTEVRDDEVSSAAQDRSPRPRA